MAAMAFRREEVFERRKLRREPADIARELGLPGYIVRRDIMWIRQQMPGWKPSARRPHEHCGSTDIPVMSSRQRCVWLADSIWELAGQRARDLSSSKIRLGW
jgi:hypothetical protein